MKLIASYLPSLLLAFGLGSGLWGIHWALIGRHSDLGMSANSHDSETYETALLTATTG